MRGTRRLTETPWFRAGFARGRSDLAAYGKARWRSLQRSEPLLSRWSIRPPAARYSKGTTCCMTYELTSCVGWDAAPKPPTLIGAPSAWSATKRSDDFSRSVFERSVRTQQLDLHDRPDLD